MASIKSVGKVFAIIVSGIAIVVVGGFMMGAVARLWLPKDKKDKQKSIQDSDDKKTD